MKRFFFGMFAFVCISAQVCAGTSLIFSGEAENGFNLYKVELDSMQIASITTSESNELMPAVSPDGRSLVFVSDRDGADSLYMLPLDAPDKDWKNISAGMGAHANPSFAPDGGRIAVCYAPDPEEPLLNTRILVINLETNAREVAVDSRQIAAPEENVAGSVLVVDRPVWFNDTTIVFVQLEYSDAVFGRITKSTIYKKDLAGGTMSRLVGGESYFDEQGGPKGYMATMPNAALGSDGNPAIAFVGAEGRFRRFPMTMGPDGNDKKVLPLNDQLFWGPVLVEKTRYIYVIQDEQGRHAIAVKNTGKDASRIVIPFSGEAWQPVLAP